MKTTVRVLAFLCAFVSAGAMAQQVPQTQAEMRLSFSPIVKKTAPAVVNIYAKVKVKQRVVSPFFNDPFFNQFFGRQMGGPVTERLENSLGSGVIVDPSGLIATNTHVVRNATEIIAVTTDGREFPAEKILSDDKTDLAVLRINPNGEQLSWLDMSDSDLLEVGDLVLAIGNPFGVGQTVTSGIVSGLARTAVGGTGYSFFIQTDAAINPGNSGGALVNMQGQLVGINSMIFSKDGGSLGIGFAIPANMVKAVVNASKTGGKIVRPWTGITGQPVTADMVEGLGLKRAVGALVNKVHPKGAAAKAGIKPGDVILKMNGYDIQDPEAMKFRLATVEMGSDVQLSVFRSGKTIDVTMVASPAPEDIDREQTLLTGANPLAGAEVANLSAALADELGLDAEKQGVIVLKAEQGAAAGLGIRNGDIIVGVNGQKIANVSALKKLLDSAKTRRWQIVIQRGAQILNLVITI